MNGGGAPLQQQGVPPAASEGPVGRQGDALPASYDGEAVRQMESYPGFIFREDTGLDCPDAGAFGGGRRGFQQSRSNTKPPRHPGHINRVFDHPVRCGGEAVR